MPAAGGKFWNFGFQKSKETLQKFIENTVETKEIAFLKEDILKKFSRLQRATTMPYIR